MGAYRKLRFPITSIDQPGTCGEVVVPALCSLITCPLDLPSVGCAATRGSVHSSVGNRGGAAPPLSDSGHSLTIC